MAKATKAPAPAAQNDGPKPGPEPVITSGRKPKEEKPPVKAGPEPSKALVETSASHSVIAYSGRANVPAHMAKYAGQGTEAFGSEDVPLPRLKIMQANSPELLEHDDGKVGDFWHNGAEVFFEDTLRVVPIYTDLRYILWNPRDAGGGILARADDGIHWNPPDKEFVVTLDAKDGGHTVKWRTARTVAQSGLNQWGTQNPNVGKSPPAATKMFNFLFAFLDYPDIPPAIFSFQRSSLGVGGKFINKIRTMSGAPMWGTVFEIKTFVDRNKKGDNFRNIITTGAGLVESTELFEHYTELHEVYVKQGFKLKDIETAQNDDTDQGDVDAGAGAGEGKPGF